MPDTDEEQPRAPRGHEDYSVRAVDEPTPTEPSSGVEPPPEED